MSLNTNFEVAIVISKHFEIFLQYVPNFHVYLGDLHRDFVNSKRNTQDIIPINDSSTIAVSIFQDYKFMNATYFIRIISLLSDTNSMRTNYLRSEDFYMAVAYLAAQRSKDPITQVGACIVNEQGVIVGVGHNHMPKDSDDFPWARRVEGILNKYPYGG